jgi:hypothetical protein
VSRIHQALSLLAAGLALLLAGCDYSPSYTGSLCAPGGGCPSGFVCVLQGEEHRCVPEDQVLDGGDGEDAGPDGADGEDAGPDGADGEDAGPDGADSEDAGPDGADEQTGCMPACLVNQYCDEESWTCKPCEDSSHCGSSCQPCDPGAGETCHNLGTDGFCCLGPCEYASACQKKDCHGQTYLCRPSFNPVAFAWTKLEQAERTIFCPLSESDGMLPERRCHANGVDLLVNCPWDGKCQPDGSCQIDLSIERTYNCGQSFGCEEGRCRLHLAPGQRCTFNWDCDSYCCSRDEISVCLQAGTDAGQCKIREARFWRGGDRRCLRTPSHDRSAWGSVGDVGQCSIACTHDRDCDSGDCDNSFLTDNSDRCVLQSCVDKDPDADIRATYFCPKGDVGVHIESVTNGAPEPTTPANCVYQPG